MGAIYVEKFVIKALKVIYGIFGGFWKRDENRTESIPRQTGCRVHFVLVLRGTIPTAGSNIFNWSQSD